MRFSVNKKSIFTGFIILGIVFTQPSIVSIAENSPIIFVLAIICGLLLQPTIQFHRGYFWLGSLLLLSSLLFFLMTYNFKLSFVAFGLLFSLFAGSTFNLIWPRRLAYSFFLLQASVFFFPELMPGLLPERRYETIGTFSGTYAEPGYLAISTILVGYFYWSRQIQILSLLTILMSGSFFGLILFFCRFLTRESALFFAFGAAVFSVGLLDGALSVFRGFDRMSLVLQLSITDYALIDQSSSFRFLMLFYNFYHTLENYVFFPAGLWVPFDLFDFMYDFYGERFYPALRKTVELDGHTSSSIAGYALQGGLLWFMGLTAVVISALKGLSINKFLPLAAIFLLQSFSIDLLFWYTLFWVKYDRKRSNEDY